VYYIDEFIFVIAFVIGLLTDSKKEVERERAKEKKKKKNVSLNLNKK